MEYMNLFEDEMKQLENMKKGLESLRKEVVTPKKLSSYFCFPMWRSLEPGDIYSKDERGMSKKFNSSELVSLDEKVDSFIKWYYQNMVLGKVTEWEEYYAPRKLRDFIEKMASWYELRWPKERILSEMMNDNSKNIDDFNRKYCFNYYEFVNSLSEEEKSFLKGPTYVDIVWVGLYAHLQLSLDGIVVRAQGIEKYTNGKIKSKDLEFLHLKEVVSLFQKNGIELSKNNEMERAILNYENEVYFYEKLLDCVMYRIIERGGSIIGARRGFLFAKNFERKIDIPMMYGIEEENPYLEKFIEEYIQSGGSMDLVCYVDYFKAFHKNDKLRMVSLKEVIDSILKGKENNGDKKEVDKKVKVRKNKIRNFRK